MFRIPNAFLKRDNENKRDKKRRAKRMRIEKAKRDGHCDRNG